MINIIGIVDMSPIIYDESTLENKGLGGSESWVVFISEALARIPNTRIYIFNNGITHIHKSSPNIIYYHNTDFFTINIKFDALIFSRSIFDLHILKIAKSQCCDNIYLFGHDVNLIFYDTSGETTKPYLINDKVLETPFFKKYLKKIFCISEFHKQIFIKQGINPNLIELSSHGIDKKLIEMNKKSQTIEKDNNIFWSNSLDRGFDTLVDKIYPKLVKKIPDLKITVSHYDNLKYQKKETLDLLNRDYIEVIGSLSKEKLYEEHAKHKCCFYPLTFPETFCITTMEQILCNCELVMPLRFGPETIFKPYKYLFFDDQIDFSLNKNIKIAVNTILDRIENFDSPERIAIRKSMQKYLIDTYNWDNIALDLFNKIGLKK